MKGNVALFIAVVVILGIGMIAYDPKTQALTGNAFFDLGDLSPTLTGYSWFDTVWDPMDPKNPFVAIEPPGSPSVASLGLQGGSESGFSLAQPLIGESTGNVDSEYAQLLVLAKLDFIITELADIRADIDDLKKNGGSNNVAADSSDKKDDEKEGDLPLPSESEPIKFCTASCECYYYFDFAVCQPKNGGQSSPVPGCHVDSKVTYELRWVCDENPSDADLTRKCYNKCEEAKSEQSVPTTPPATCTAAAKQAACSQFADPHYPITYNPPRIGFGASPQR